MSPRPWRLLPADLLGASALFVLGASVLAAGLTEAGADATPIAARRLIVVGPPAAAVPAASAAPEEATEVGDVAAPEPGIPAPAAEPFLVAPVAATPAPATSEEPADTGDDTVAGSDAPELPPVKHVWVVPLGIGTLDEIAAPDQPSYLRDELRPKALALPGYTTGGAAALAEEVTLLSGRRPTPPQTAGCPQYTDGDCVRPASVTTLVNQLTEAGRTWRGYVDAPAPEPGRSACRPDAAPGNPFLLFHAIADSPDCGSGIATPDRLAPDAEDPDSAPAFALVVPGAAAQQQGLDAWLHDVLGPLLESKAYADGGAVLVTTKQGALVLSPLAEAGGQLDGTFGPADVLRTVDDLLALEPLATAADADGFLRSAFSLQLHDEATT